MMLKQFSLNRYTINKRCSTLCVYGVGAVISLLWLAAVEEGGRLSGEAYWECLHSDRWLPCWKRSSAWRESCW